MLEFFIILTKFSSSSLEKNLSSSGAARPLGLPRFFMCPDMMGEEVKEDVFEEE